MPRTFPPLPAGHPAVGRPCDSCTVPFVAGDTTTIYRPAPADPENQAKADAGEAHLAAGGLAHATCATASPQTKGQALALARMWGRTLSHWNECANASPDDTARAMAESARADAAEVQRLAALWTMLPDVAEPEPDEDDLAPLLDSNIGRLRWMGERCRDAWAVLRAVPYNDAQAALNRHERPILNADVVLGLPDGLADDMLEVAATLDPKP
jgi:hypothetical protein